MDLDHRRSGGQTSDSQSFCVWTAGKPREEKAKFIPTPGHDPEVLWPEEWIGRWVIAIYDG